MDVSDDDMGSLESNAGIQNESRSPLVIEGVPLMRIKLNYLTPLLAAGAVAAAIAAAPTATAAACHIMDGSPVCPDTHSTPISSPPRNSPINASPGAIDPAPQYPYGSLGFKMGI
jgi:hypothetical protein